MLYEVITIVKDVLTALLLDVVLDLVLIDLHVVAPGSDYREVGALDGILAVVGTTGYLELELVGQGRTVYVVGEVVDQETMDGVLMCTGHLAVGGADRNNFV